MAGDAWIDPENEEDAGETHHDSRDRPGTGPLAKKGGGEERDEERRGRAQHRCARRRRAVCPQRLQSDRAAVADDAKRDQRQPVGPAQSGNLAAGDQPGVVSLASIARDYVRLIGDLMARGYFERDFEKDCVDDPATINPSDVVEAAIG